MISCIQQYFHAILQVNGRYLIHQKVDNVIFNIRITESAMDEAGAVNSP